MGFALSSSTSCCPTGRAGTCVSIIAVWATMAVSPDSHTIVNRKINRFVIVFKFFSYYSNLYSEAVNESEGEGTVVAGAA